MSKLNKVLHNMYSIGIAGMAICSIVISAELIINDRIQQEKDMQCVYDLLDSGLERSDIKMIGGVCYVGENIYYTSQ